MMKTILQICGSLACLSAATLTLSLTLQSRDLSRQITATASEMRMAAEQVNRTIARTDRVMALYQRDLESDRSRKALQASLEAAAAWKATARLVNVTIVPNINRTLMEMQRTTARLGNVADAATTLVEDQNANIGRTMGRIEGLIQTTDGVARGLGEQSARVGADLSSTLRTSDDSIRAAGRTIEELNRSSMEITALLHNLREASGRAPAIADQLEKMARSGAKWQRPLSLATLLIALFGALR